ncbi:MAG: transglycosylase SLT domain-containing protein [Bacteroidales bacterium]|jgi:membrane-bound lytic murein transglycosylase D|nr:transglycosylase SLT domain-containing protein [Bacteroidales bacterium]
MTPNKSYLLLFALVPFLSYSSDLQFKIGKNRKDKEKAQSTLISDTIYVTDTVYIESKDALKREARVIDYSDKTLAAFDEDAVSLFAEWKSSFISKDDTFDASSLSPNYSDSIYQDRLLEMSENMVIEMPFNKIVKAHIKVYTERKRTHSAYVMGEIGYYMPIFESELDRKGLPIELRCVPIIESGLKPRAYSRAGASGLWQFIYSTGKYYGLEMNSYIDERRDPIEATQSAVRYFEDLYAVYKDWYLVIAAYNCGPGNVNKAIRRSGGKRDYWAIYYYLPRETRGYVPAFIAANYLIHYSEEHNIKPSITDLPTFTDTVMVSKALNLIQVAEVMNIDIDLLRDLNPQYRLDIIPGGKKSYTLTLPGTASADYVVMEDSIMAYKREILIDKKRTNVQPGSSTYTASRGAVPAGKVALTYNVKSGDNLGFIAEWYDVRVSDLRHWNNIYRNMIRVDQKLTVYVPKGKENKYKNIGKTKNAPKVTPNAATDLAVDLNAEYDYYQVRNGDNLWVIARRYPGVSAENIKAINGMGSNDIKPGQYIKIRKKS